MMGEGEGDGVEATALPAPSLRGLAHRVAGRCVSSAGIGRNSARREGGG